MSLILTSNSELACPDYCIYDAGHTCNLCERFTNTLFYKIALENGLINKPVTTTNEQPKSKCGCAEGFQGLCANHIEEGPLEGHCQLNLIDTFRPIG